MRLRDHVSRDLVFILRGMADKRGFLAQLVALIVDRCPEVNGAILLQRLLEREEQVTTGIGHGVAIPHAVVEQLDRTRCVVVQTPEGLDYEALDGSPVHVFFVLLSPPQSTGVHIRLLARIARLADSAQFIAHIVAALSEDAIHTLILDEDGRHV